MKYGPNRPEGQGLRGARGGKKGRAYTRDKTDDSRKTRNQRTSCTKKLKIPKKVKSEDDVRRTVKKKNDIHNDKKTESVHPSIHHDYYQEEYRSRSNKSRKKRQSYERVRVIPGSTSVRPSIHPSIHKSTFKSQLPCGRCTPQRPSYSDVDAPVAASSSPH